jgi:hypothetical protein
MVATGKSYISEICVLLLILPITGFICQYVEFIHFDFLK